MIRHRDDLSYHNAETSSHGLMVCAACRKPITAGEYRCRELPDEYVNHHRGCCATDPMWDERDRQARARIERHERLCVEAKAFFDKWGVSDLSDYIEGETP